MARTANYSDYVTRLSGLLGVDPATLIDTEKKAWNGFFIKNAKGIWEENRWLDNCLVESRTPDVNQLIAFEQAGQTKIGEFFQVWNQDPYAVRSPRRLGYLLTPDGAKIICPLNSTTVYVYFRTQIPSYCGPDFSGSLTYSAGKTVYYVTTAGAGNFYTCVTSTSTGDSPDSAPAKWAIQEVPYHFFEYIIHASYADVLRSDGQNDKANQADSQARNILDHEHDRMERQQRFVPETVFNTYLTSRPLY